MVDLPEDVESAWSSMYEELFVEHREVAIEEFVKARLQSYYIDNPSLLKPGVEIYKEANKLIESSPRAALILNVTATEIFLKCGLLRPIVFGLVHNEVLAEIIMGTALGQSGVDRYQKLLCAIFKEIKGIDLADYKREGGSKSLLLEAKEIQLQRNKVIHGGDKVSEKHAQISGRIAEEFFQHAVDLLAKLDMNIDSDGFVEVHKY